MAGSIVWGEIPDTTSINKLKVLAEDMYNRGEYKKSLDLSAQMQDEASKVSYFKGIAYALRISGQSYLSLSEYEKALGCLEKAKVIFRSLRMQSDLAYTIISIGKVYGHLSKYELALKEYDGVLDLLIVLHDQSLKAIVLNNIGNIQFAKGSYERALEFYLKSLKEGANLPNGRRFTAPQNNIGVVHAKLQRYKEALYYFSSYLNEIRNVGQKRDVANVLLNIGEVHGKTGNFSQALAYLDSAVTIQSQLNDRRGLALSFSNLAFAHANLNHTKSAFKLYEMSIELARAIEEDDVLLNPLFGICALYIKSNQFDRAEKIAIEINETANAMKSKLWQEQALLLSSKLDSAKRNYTGAYLWLKKYIPLHDSLFNEQNSRHVIQMREQYEAEKKDKEIQLLEEGKKFAELKQTSQRNLFILIFIFLSLSAGFALCWGQVKSKNLKLFKRQKEKIAKANNELEFLLKRVEQQNKTLEAKNDLLKELHLEKDALIGIVAHDLRSPLNRIKGLTNILSLQYSKDADQEFIMNNIRKVCDDGNNLIRDLLEINEYETSDQPPEFKEIDVIKLNQEIIDSYAPVAHSKSLLIKYEYDDEELVMLGDSGYLARILDNLLSNAIKFSPPGSRVLVRIGLSQGNNVKISIKDEGPGFSADDMQHLFKRFKKLSARPTAGEYSTGLGLSIVKKLIDKLDGTIEVITTPGQGAEFVLLLPSLKPHLNKSVYKEFA